MNQTVNLKVAEYPVFNVEGENRKSNTIDLCLYLVKSLQGISYNDMKNLQSILKRCEEANKELETGEKEEIVYLKLTQKDVINLKHIATNHRWPRYDEAVINFIDEIQKL